MGYYNRGGYRSNSRGRIGREKALEHIREAEALSKELGGTDQDVKNYFFSLSGSQLKEILDKYEKKYGESAREYAELTFSKWKSGKVHMSGMVAERLFKLLPPIMPLETKFRLVESLWKHVGPSSTKIYYIGLDADLGVLFQKVKEHLQEVVTYYTIPECMEARFNWLSQGDINVKQQLLNFFRQQEKQLLSEALKTQLPMLMSHLNSQKGTLTNHVAQVVKVGKHQVKIIVDEQVQGISEAMPTIPKDEGTSSGGLGWLWWIVGAGVALWLMSM